MWQQILEFTGVIPEYLTECVYSRYDNGWVLGSGTKYRETGYGGRTGYQGRVLCRGKFKD